MPLIVSESKSAQDPSQSSLTQALLSPSHGEEEEDLGVNSQETSFSDGSSEESSKRRQNVPELRRDIMLSPASLSSTGKKGSDLQDATEMRLVRKLQEFTMKTLGWLTCPVNSCQEDTELPAISVYSDPEVSEELEMIIHSNGEGTAQTTGQRRVSLRSQGSNKPSVATFEGIQIKRAGLYVVEVHSVRQPELSLVADHPLTIVPKFALHSGEVSLPEELGMAKAQMWGA